VTFSSRLWFDEFLKKQDWLLPAHWLLANTGSLLVNKFSNTLSRTQFHTAIVVESTL